MNGKANFNILLLVLVLVLLPTGRTLYGAIIYVPADFNSIQVAIDAAVSYEDEIEVAPGMYNEAINFNGKSVRLYSIGGPDVTTIDANDIAGAYHVVQCVSGEGPGTVLEGFTITGGDANGESIPYNCGGGMYNYQSSPTVTDCTFYNNIANMDGGGMSNNESSPTVTNCIFIGNRARYAGGMANAGDSPTVTNCTFYNNTANGNCGGMFNSQSNPTVINCTFYNNTANGNCGGMKNLNSKPLVTNCTFTGNSAGSFGGGMYNDNSTPSVTNCTFSGNRAITYKGGGIYNYKSITTVINCIFWGDTPDEIYNSSFSATVTYSNVQGGWVGMGNIDADPCFVDASNPDLNLWNLRLKPDSPCIDAGDTIVFSLPLDLDGNPRAIDDPRTTDTGLSLLGVTVDMGAYEFEPCRIPGDNNCDGVVNFKDVAILCNNWLAGTEQK